jgi:O-antigen ligase
MTGSESGTLEHSAAVRLTLWNTAIQLFENSPIIGSGFSSFKLSMQGEPLTDTHNFFIKTACEGGIVGIVLLLFILLKALKSGFELWRIGKTTFHKGLAFGFLGSVFAVMITNIFGDRWSYIEIGTYFWVCWGLVDRGLLLSRVPEAEVISGIPSANMKQDDLYVPV